MIKYQPTVYGFIYGNAEVERIFSDEKTGKVFMSLKTSNDELQISVTKTGKIRIFSKKYITEIKEWKYTEWKKEV